LVKKGEFDLVIAGVFPYNIFIYLGQRIARRSKCPFIIAPFLHLGEKERGEVRRHFIIPHQLELVKKSDFSITLTSAEIPYLTSIGVDRSKIEIISPGINPRTLRGGIGENFRKKYGLSSTEKIVFQISHQAVDKGSVCLLEAMKMLWNNGYQAKLILAGPIYNDFYTHFLAQSPAVFEKCFVLEYISEQEKKDLLSAGDIFVMTSRVESFGIVYLEAWFYKKPIIAAFTESTSKIITDGHNGFLTPFGDVHFLAEYIAGLLDNPSLAQQLGEAGYVEVVNKYTWAHQFPKMEKVVENLKKPFSRSGGGV
jgi:glycosyltransferase involved in cell wall biosynthesis